MGSFGHSEIGLFGTIFLRLSPSHDIAERIIAEVDTFDSGN